MDKRRENPLLHFYELELEHLRGMAAEFREAYPKIADRLALSPKTVDTYRSRIMQKIGVRDVTELVKFAIRHGIISLD